MEQSEQSISFDDMMIALANAQRRKLLMSLLEHNPQADSLVVNAGSDDEAAAVEGLVPMRHAHLPKLSDYGFIEWNEGSNFSMITKTSCPQTGYSFLTDCSQPALSDV